MLLNLTRRSRKRPAPRPERAVTMQPRATPWDLVVRSSQSPLRSRGKTSSSPGTGRNNAAQGNALVLVSSPGTGREIIPGQRPGTWSVQISPSPVRASQSPSFPGKSLVMCDPRTSKPGFETRRPP